MCQNWIEFIEEYAKCYNGGKAYKKLHPDCAMQTCYNQAHEILKNEEALAYLKKIQEDAVKSYGDIAQLLIQTLAENATTYEEDGKHHEGWQKSVELIQKQLGLNQTNINADVKEAVQFIDDIKDGTDQDK